MFAGIGGSGVKDMPSSHSLAMPKKCVTCHMYREEKDNVLKKGGHTFRSDDRICLKCHEDPKSLAKKYQAETSLLLKQLKTLLDNTSDKTSPSYRTAKMNYDMVVADRGVGLHNPKYAQALLKYSIASLKVASVWKK